MISTYYEKKTLLYDSLGVWQLMDSFIIIIIIRRIIELEGLAFS